jgi:hypothetical protein
MVLGIFGSSGVYDIEGLTNIHQPSREMVAELFR